MDGWMFTASNKQRTAATLLMITAAKVMMPKMDMRKWCFYIHFMLSFLIIRKVPSMHTPAVSSMRPWCHPPLKSMSLTCRKGVDLCSMSSLLVSFHTNRPLNAAITIVRHLHPLQEERPFPIHNVWTSTTRHSEKISSKGGIWRRINGQKKTISRWSIKN